MEDTLFVISHLIFPFYGLKQCLKYIIWFDTGKKSKQFRKLKRCYNNVQICKTCQIAGYFCTAAKLFRRQLLATSGMFSDCNHLPAGDRNLAVSTCAFTRTNIYMHKEDTPVEPNLCSKIKVAYINTYFRKKNLNERQLFIACSIKKILI